MREQNFPFRLLRRFRREEAGAVTVDWVVLTSVVVAALLMLFSILTETIFEDTATAIADDIDASAAGTF